MPTEITVHGEKFQRLDYITSKWVGKIKINLKLKSARGKTVNESVRFRFFFFFAVYRTNCSGIGTHFNQIN